MADNNLNDEYEFADLDMLDTDELGGAKDENAYQAPSDSGTRSGSQIRRNALIVLLLAVLGMLAYKFAGVFFTHKSTQQTVAPVQPTLPAEVPSAPVVAPQPEPAPTPTTSETDQHLSTLDAQQQNLRSEVGSLTDQINTLSANINELASKISSLNQELGDVTTKLNEQNGQISVLTNRVLRLTHPPIVSRPKPAVMFYIQAVIPGRAWLIGSNGTTISVRDGTKIPGYGVVKSIDPKRGRVVTSSGQVIRFGQQDS